MVAGTERAHSHDVNDSTILKIAVKTTEPFVWCIERLPVPVRPFPCPTARSSSEADQLIRNRPHGRRSSTQSDATTPKPSHHDDSPSSVSWCVLLRWNHFGTSIAPRRS